MDTTTTINVNVSGSLDISEAPAKPITGLQPSKPETIRTFDDPILTEVCDITDFEACLRTASTLIASALKSETLAAGLAAPQIGSLCRVFVWRDGGDAPFKVAINPSIRPAKGAKTVAGPEGCLSYPKHATEVLRLNKIRVTYTDEHNKSQSAFLRGFEAVVFQHEFDHLRGICPVARAWKAETARVAKLKAEDEAEEAIAQD